jgi:hypothetical protein
MAVRYDPAAENVHSGSIGGTGASSVSQAMADGSDYPGAGDASWFQAGGYTPDGLYKTVYSGASVAPHAAAVPAGRDILGVEVAMLAQVPTGGGVGGQGVQTTSMVTFQGTRGDVVLWKDWNSPSVEWGRTVDAGYFVPAAEVPNFLATARIIVSQRVPLAFPVRIDYFSVYVVFTVGFTVEAVIPITVSGPGEASEQHIGGHFPAVVI